MPRSRPSSILIQHPPDSMISPSSSVSSREFVPRRIRFAPLPEPDRDDTSKIVAPESSEPDPLPEDLLASSSSSSSSQSIISGSLIIPGQSDDSSPDSSVGSSPMILVAPLPSKYPDYINSPSSPTFSEISYVKKSHPLLRPFKRFYTASSGSSSNTLTPTSSIDNHGRKSVTKEEILSLGVVNLFRTTSRESTQSASSLSRWGSGLTAWPSSAGSTISLPSGSSLSRTQSAQSYKSNSNSRFPVFSSSTLSLSSDSKTKAKAKPTPLGQTRNRHKGTVMLNGRVYGAKKNTNLFATARDEEPEFVEWGYGGMGSVKGAKSAGVSSNWDKLHGDLATDSRASRVGATDDADSDDGSGLAWVRRRKEERERKAREQKEKEAEREISESQTNTPTRTSTLETIRGIPSISLPPSAIETTTSQRPPAIDVPTLDLVPEDGETATTANFPTPTRHSEPGELSPSSSPPLTGNGKAEGEHSTHVLQAINVPVRSPRHPRPCPKGSRELSISGERSAVVPQVQVAGSPILVSASGDDDDSTDATAGVVHSSAVTPDEIKGEPQLTSSSSESESESEVDEDDDGDDEEEEEEDAEERRRGGGTLGNAAGVEKISRHNKE